MNKIPRAMFYCVGIKIEMLFLDLQLLLTVNTLNYREGYRHKFQNKLWVPSLQKSVTFKTQVRAQLLSRFWPVIYKDASCITKHLLNNKHISRYCQFHKTLLRNGKSHWFMQEWMNKNPPNFLFLLIKKQIFSNRKRQHNPNPTKTVSLVFFRT